MCLSIPHVSVVFVSVLLCQLSASNLVSSVRTTRDASESERRRLAEHARAERIEKLDSELKEATRLNQEIEANWENVAQKSQ